MRVRELREARGWSQRALASQMHSRGFNWLQSTAAKVEAADRPVRVDEAVALAELLEVDIGHLVLPSQHPSVERLSVLLNRYAAATSEYKAKGDELAIKADELKSLGSTAADLRHKIDALKAAIDHARGASLYEPDTVREIVRNFEIDWPVVLSELNATEEVLEVAREEDARRGDQSGG